MHPLLDSLLKQTPTAVVAVVAIVTMSDDHRHHTTTLSRQINVDREYYDSWRNEAGPMFEECIRGGGLTGELEDNQKAVRELLEEILTLLFQANDPIHDNDPHP